jgi:hypothetical protein
MVGGRRYHRKPALSSDTHIGPTVGWIQTSRRTYDAQPGSVPEFPPPCRLSIDQLGERILFPSR